MTAAAGCMVGRFHRLSLRCIIRNELPCSANSGPTLYFPICYAMSNFSISEYLLVCISGHTKKWMNLLLSHYGKRVN